MLNRNRQRGITFEIVLLLVCGVMILGAITAFTAKMYSTGKAAGVTQEAPKIAAATERAVAAEQRASELNAELEKTIASNKRSQEQVAKLEVLVQEVQDEWELVKLWQKDQEAKTRAALASYAERDKRQMAEVKRLREIAASSVITITDGVPDEADAILRSTIRDILGLR